MVILAESRTRTVKVYRSQTDFDVLTEADTLDGGVCGAGLAHARV